MLNTLKKRIKNEKGLSLVELLAVIVILAIVSAIAIPAIGNIIANSKVKAEISDAIQVVNAANIYFTDNPDADVFTEAEAGDYVELNNADVTFTVSGDTRPLEVSYTGDYLDGTAYSLAGLSELKVSGGKIVE